MALADSLEGFLANLHDAAQSLELDDRQLALRLVVKEVQVEPDSINRHQAVNSARRPPSDPRFIYCVQGIVNTQIGAT